MNAFLQAYITCALWSSLQDNGDPMDDDFGPDDIAPETLEKMRADCADFCEANAELLAQAGNDEQNGHDFWLTRNRHGAGFWDRGYSYAIGNALSDAAHVYGNCDLYIGDDGRIHL